MDIYKITMRLHDCFDLFSFLCVQNSLKYFLKIVPMQMNLVLPINVQNKEKEKNGVNEQISVAPTCQF